MSDILRLGSEFVGIAFVLISVTMALYFLLRSHFADRRSKRVFEAHQQLIARLVNRLGTRPVMMQVSPSPLGIPGSHAGLVRRSLSSFQIGAPVALAGVGVLMATDGLRGDVGPDGAALLFGAGVLLLFVGGGFVVSSGATFLTGYVAQPGREDYRAYRDGSREPPIQEVP